VQHDPSMKYLALSYVWGKSGLAHSGETLINAPQTVKDAMYATKRLGQRYLWVDRYCIPQEGNERHVHIANMNSIYEAAYVTNRCCQSGPKRFRTFWLVRSVEAAQLPDQIQSPWQSFRVNAPAYIILVVTIGLGDPRLDLPGSSLVKPMFVFHTRSSLLCRHL